jgi:demethyllactenocin mycarosyltransferase
MAHIAFVGVPAAGHVNPTVGLVAELVARGHRVSYAVPTAFATGVAAAGARVVDYKTTMADFADTMLSFGSPDRFSIEEFVRVQEGLLRETVALLAPLTRAFAEDRPDLVVHDTLCWAGRLLAAGWGVPAVRSQPMLATNDHWSFESGYATTDRRHPGVVRVERAVGRLLRRLRMALTVEELFARDDRTPTLVYLPRAFQYAGDTFGAHTHFVGPCLRRPPEPSTRRPDRPLVLVSLGTVYNGQADFFRTCLAAFTGAPWDGVIVTGDRVDRAELGDPPPNVEVHGWLPEILDVTRRASALVNHASMASTMESLAHGVPLVVVPQMAEQRANADRVVELGLGVRIALTAVTARSLRSGVAAVLADQAMRTRALGWRDQIARAGGAPAAADVLEKHLAADVLEQQPVTGT